MVFLNKEIGAETEKELQESIEKFSYDLNEGLQPLLDKVGDARIVLLGEATHVVHSIIISGGH